MKKDMLCIIGKKEQVEKLLIIHLQYTTGLKNNL